RNLQLEAEVTDGSHSPQATAEWKVRYRFRCGPEFQAVMDTGVSQGLAPRNGHFERNLHVEAAGSPQFKADPNRAICDSTNCVKPCMMARQIHNQLDGHVVGYSFFVGLSPKFEAHGQARTLANGMVREFTSKTKITTASVSKLVTAIAAIRILD